MARNISNIHDLITFIENKERGTFTTPAQKDIALNSGQIDVYNKYVAPYLAGDDNIHDALKPFKVNYQFTSAADGTVSLPSDAVHLLKNIFTVTGSTVNRVRILNEAQWVDAITNQLRPVNSTNPICKEYGRGFNLYPQTLQIGILSYLKMPVAPVYGYDQVGRVITYNPATSTQIEFDDVYVNDIIARAMFYIGFNLSEKDIIEFDKLYNQ